MIGREKGVAVGSELTDRKQTADTIGDDFVVAPIVAAFASAALRERLREVDHLIQDAWAVNLPHMAGRYHHRQPSRIFQEAASLATHLSRRTWHRPHDLARRLVLALPLVRDQP